ncbi:MAG: radical SAM protein [Isosphaeraceae bacterium]|nr:radical SAM protein [Isosphaeraceae bacterium]
MASGLLSELAEAEGTPSRPRPRLALVERRRPVLRPSQQPEVWGIDLTAGCGLACPFCQIRALPSFPPEDRVLFDPRVGARLAVELDSLDEAPRLVVLSPASDPLLPSREVREATWEVLRLLLSRGIDILLMTRGRIPKGLIALLAEWPERVRVAVGMMTLDPALGRLLEGRAAPPRARLRGLARLVEAGVRVEVRLEPLIAGLTDSRENLQPLFAALAEAGARRIVAHYLFLNPAINEGLEGPLGPLGWGERLADAYQGGPVFRLGSLGVTKHLPLEARQEGLARLVAWGAEHGLVVATGATQNPDLPRLAGAGTPSETEEGGWGLKRFSFQGASPSGTRS